MSSNISRKLRTADRAAGKDKSNINDKDKGQGANIWKLLCTSEDSNTVTSVSSLEHLNNNFPWIRTQMSLIIWDCNSPLGKNLFKHNDSLKITGTGINNITWSHRGAALHTAHSGDRFLVTRMPSKWNRQCRTDRHKELQQINDSKSSELED